MMMMMMMAAQTPGDQELTWDPEGLSDTLLASWNRRKKMDI